MIDSAQREQAALGLEQLASLVRAQSWRTTETPPLPPTQAAVIRMLSGATEDGQARRIAERLGISAASLSDSLKALEARGWISRVADPADRRSSRIRLTRAGSAIGKRLRDPEHGIGRLVRNLDPVDVGTLLRLTQLLVMQAQRDGLATGLRTCLGCRFFRPFAGSRDRPHFCDFIGQPFGDAELRVDCAEHSPAEENQLAGNLARFRLPDPSPTD